MAEEKIDVLLKFVEVLKQEHYPAQCDLRKRLEHLEKEVSMRQEDAMQWGVKCLKEDRTLVFWKKSNEHQFIFNDNIKNQLDAVRKHLEHLGPLSEVHKNHSKKLRRSCKKVCC